MCEFISWIEYGGKLFYLTDYDIFSKHVKEVLAGCRGNDFLGHGAIRKFWNLQGGEEKEAKNFWELEKLPKELALMVKDFDKHWSKTFKTYFQNDDLVHIIRDAPKGWKAKALEQLLKQKPSNDDLCCIIRDAPKEQKVKVSEQLLRQKPSNDDLCCIIRDAPKEQKVKASEQLLKQKPSNDDLYYIISYAPKKWEDKARRILEGSR